MPACAAKSAPCSGRCERTGRCVGSRRSRRPITPASYRRTRVIPAKVGIWRQMCTPPCIPGRQTNSFPAAPSHCLTNDSSTRFSESQPSALSRHTTTVYTPGAFSKPPMLAEKLNLSDVSLHSSATTSVLSRPT